VEGIENNAGIGEIGSILGAELK